jgi:gluconolactonase
MITRRGILAGAGAAMAWAMLPAGALAAREKRTPASPERLAAAKGHSVVTPPIRTVPPVNLRVIAEGLRLPEGPIVMADGTVLVVEVEGRCLSRCYPDGSVETVAELGGGPNGAAIGPDGACYIANNGGFVWAKGEAGITLPTQDLGDYTGGSIQRVDLATGKVATLYDSVDGRRLSSPNDLVFDDGGGFWFTDWGKPRARTTDRGGLYYAKADGSMIREAVFPLVTPNGIALSADGRTLYVGESSRGRLLVGEVKAPGEIGGEGGVAVMGMPPLKLLAAPGGNTGFDGMKLEADGSICLATSEKGGITRVSADGKTIEHTPLDDFITTNLAFGGADMKTCYVTLGASGRLVAMDWPRPGQKVRFQS